MSRPIYHTDSDIANEHAGLKHVGDAMGWGTYYAADPLSSHDGLYLMGTRMVPSEYKRRNYPSSFFKENGFWISQAKVNEIAATLGWPLIVVECDDKFLVYEGSSFRGTTTGGRTDRGDSADVETMYEYRPPFKEVDK